MLVLRHQNTTGLIMVIDTNDCQAVRSDVNPHTDKDGGNLEATCGS